MMFSDVFHAFDEVSDALPAEPESLHAGFAIAFASDEAPGFLHLSLAIGI